MERLIVEMVCGDGYTYSCTNTVPIVFSSKEEFLIVLEDKLRNSKKEYAAIQEKYEENQEKIMSAFKSLRKEEAYLSKLLCDELEKLNTQSIELSEEMKKVKTFILAGQKFSIDSFELSSAGNFFLPNVYTLDEFFSNVESNLNDQI